MQEEQTQILQFYRTTFFQISMNESVELPGIVYLSSLPMYMGVNKVREKFSQFGDLGRIYLARAPSKGKKSNIFTEVHYFALLVSF